MGNSVVEYLKMSGVKSNSKFPFLLEVLSVNELHEPVRHAARDEAVVGGHAEVEDRRGELDGVHLQGRGSTRVLFTCCEFCGVNGKSFFPGSHQFRKV